MNNMSDGIFEKGYERGYEIGYERGIKLGCAERKREIIDRMINTNATDEFIMDITEESKEYIEERRKILKESNLSGTKCGD